MDISQLKGLGPKRIEALKKANLCTIADLLYNIPRNYLDNTKITRISDCKIGDRVVLVGIIKRSGIIRGRKSRFLATLTDGTGEIKLLFFQSVSYFEKRIKNETRWVITGQVGDYRGLQITHPDMQPIEIDEVFTGEILPIYPINESCRKAKLEQNFFRKLYKVIFNFPNLSISNLCPKELTDYLHFKPIIESLKILHQPQNFASIYKAKRELKILELLPFCLRMVKRRESQKLRGHERSIDLGSIMNAKAKLPFQLTQGQNDAINALVEGLNGKKQFHALLQGDVGCGKTVIAMLSMLAVCNSNTLNPNEHLEQCALMVPTDILARQHYKNIKPFLEHFGLHVGLLVGSTSSAEKKVILGELQMGLINVIIGTHALFSKDVTFSNLGFVIIDEQHRFGVSQREALLSKGKYPDMLVMSATPIPRSLAMTLYGDLKIISIKDKPIGRKPIKTRLVNESKRNDMKSFICNEVLNGNLCYWIASRVEFDDENSTKSVNEIVEELQEYVTFLSKKDSKFSKIKIAGIHGQMNETERDKYISKFEKKEIHILVATTVIEVGVNVPSANIMVIDAPERFGLAQLHQLRGRVGRGNIEAWCFLMIKENESSETSAERLSQFSATEDGFEIAELDLKNRGGGNLEGTEQSGAWVFRWFDWIHDQELISQTLETANHILKDAQVFTENARERIQTWYSEKKFTNEDGIH